MIWIHYVLLQTTIALDTTKDYLKSYFQSPEYLEHDDFMLNLDFQYKTQVMILTGRIRNSRTIVGWIANFEWPAIFETRW